MLRTILFAPACYVRQKDDDITEKNTSTMLYPAMSSISGIMNYKNILNAKLRRRKNTENKNFATLRLRKFTFEKP